jgi:choloylglycine hydrolase
MEKWSNKIVMAMLAVGVVGMSTPSDACTRVLHVTKDNKSVITGRNMDWYVRYPTSLWKFPRGMERSGLSKENPLKWTSKYGSIVAIQTADGQSATADGMNEKGLVANLLYLSETEYPKRDVNKKGLASSIYLQYIFDNFATVKEAVEGLKREDIQIVPVPIPNSEHLPTMHFSLSDAGGDSAIVEILKGKVVIHHSKEYQVMANSPVFEKQLALTSYWDEIGGDKFLPGTRKSPDRFVRAHFYNKKLPEPKDYREAIAGVMSIMRNTSSPFGLPDPDKPNISTTMWRTIADQTNLVYFYESTISYGSLWVDYKKFDFSKGTEVKVLDADSGLVGNASDKFKVTKPIEFARP